MASERGQVSDPVRLLVFSTLYPHSGLPNQGVFVENRLRHLLATGEATATVLAPVPWFPFRGRRWGAWARFAHAPPFERRHAIDVHHPRYPVVPKVGMNVAPTLLFHRSLRAARRLLAGGARFDLIDAHYLYPDGVAAVRLGRALGLPVVLTARGSDVTELTEFAVPRRAVLSAVGAAGWTITVSAGLRNALLALGADGSGITVLRNGVDVHTFHPPVDRAMARRAMGLTGPTLLSVGHLIPRKAHDLVIAALDHLPEHTLLIAGEGPERSRLEKLAAARPGRVRLLGARPHAELPSLYGVADVMVLASTREGWANVLLESMACGTPVVASDIPGNDEVVGERAAGLIAPRTPEGIAAAVRDLQANPLPREDTRCYAERFGWEATSEGQLAVFRRVLGRG